MKIDRLAYMYGIDYNKFGCFEELREKLQSLRNKEYFVYREGFVISKQGRIKEPSIYKFERYFTKVQGAGHSEFGARTYDHEYEIFLTKESASEYANIKLEQYLYQKRINEQRQNEQELKMLNDLAEKFGYILIKKEIIENSTIINS